MTAQPEAADSPRTEKTKNQFGTFGGVFTPSILTILGVIMFMRSNYVVGQAGIIDAILILLIAKSITLLTSLSIGAIATNMQVKGGGAYYMISRVLGPEFGGAIGTALFFALALSVPFYVIGFTESLVATFEVLEGHEMLITFVTAGILFVVAYVGAGWAIRTQFFIMGILFLSIIAFMGGAVLLFDMDTFRANLPSYADSVRQGGTVLDRLTPMGFWAIFAIYFPAVTGIDAGVNMSGDLKEPARSIPLGTLCAVGVGFLVYLLQILLAGGAFPRVDTETGMSLVQEPFVVFRENALFGAGFLVSAGVFAATLSSALGSYMAGPRVLQAIARDPILPFLKLFAKGTVKGDEPRRALILVGVITVAVLLWAGLSKPPRPAKDAAISASAEATADAGASANAEAPEVFDPLNAVAAVVTMFFLFSYGTINLAAFIEAIGGNPSFRPRFHYFHWITALLGALGCVAAACLVNLAAAIGAGVMIGVMVRYVQQQQLTSTFGDARRGFVYRRARNNLLQLAEMEEDSRNWRPTVLVFSGNPATRDGLVSYAIWMEAGRGIVYLAYILTGKIEELAPRRTAAKKQLLTYCREHDIQAFPVVAVADNLPQGVSMLLQTASVGPIRPNMALFGWLRETDKLPSYVRQLRIASAMDISLVLLKTEDLPEDGDGKRIDIWWRGQRNGGLMLNLAHLLTRNWEWTGTRVRVLRVIENEAGRQPAMKSLQDLIKLARVDADAQVIVSDRQFTEILETHSGTATCVFLGFEMPGEGDEQGWHDAYVKMITKVKTAILVNSRGETELSS